MTSYLVDTHVLLWWWGEPKKLSRTALGLLRDPENRIFVSAASAWEMATKARIGKLPGAEVMLESFSERLFADGFADLHITAAHALRAGRLPGAHRDPFDRMLAAQSLLERLPVIGCDDAISALGAARVW